jgi:hypothetical protein
VKPDQIFDNIMRLNERSSSSSSPAEQMFEVPTLDQIQGYYNQLGNSIGVAQNHERTAIDIYSTSPGNVMVDLVDEAENTHNSSQSHEDIDS